MPKPRDEPWTVAHAKSYTPDLVIKYPDGKREIAWVLNTGGFRACVTINETEKYWVDWEVVVDLLNRNKPYEPK